jgi:hypothetical protein
MEQASYDYGFQSLTPAPEGEARTLLPGDRLEFT